MLPAAGDGHALEIMTVLPFPANIPPGINPYMYFARYLEAVFNPRPSNGFKARLIVLYVLTGV